MNISQLIAMYGSQPGIGASSTGVGVGSPPAAGASSGAGANPLQAQLLATLLGGQQPSGAGALGGLSSTLPGLAAAYMQNRNNTNQIAQNQSAFDAAMQGYQNMPMPGQ